MNIFEKLNALLVESKGEHEVKTSDIPVHPDMETKEQGEMAAAEKIFKLFQKLSAGSDGKEKVKDSKPEIPDDMIDPMMKKQPKKDKTFEKNKLAGWDEKSDEKFEKEIETQDGDEEDDEFDDFDYRQNEFGDEDDDEEEQEDFDDYDEKSEDEKLKDTIDDAIDSLSNDENQEGDEDGDDSGANWGDEEGDEENGGEQGGKSGSKSGNTQDGDEDGEQGDETKSGNTQDGGKQGKNTPNNSDKKNSGKSSTKNGGGKETKSEKQKRLEELKKSLESDNIEDFNDKIKDVKDITDTPDEFETPGGQIETPTDEEFKDDMKKGGFDDKSIEKMTKEKNTDPKDEYSEEEMEKLKKDVVDGLESSCKKKGGSALASTIVKNSLKRKINDEEWREILKIFLKAKSIYKGKTTKDNKGIKWGHKNHLWREAVLPTSAPSKGSVQNIYCFVDFSGSVNQDLVYTFLGKVIDLCAELRYTNVKVYGFGVRLTEPRVIDQKSLSDGVDVALAQTWDFIQSQEPGSATENFAVVTEEINKIKNKERTAPILIFGDGLWGDVDEGPKCLKYNIANNSYLDDICILTYYMSTKDFWYSTYIGIINLLKELVGIKHIITTKASSIHS